MNVAGPRTDLVTFGAGYPQWYRAARRVAREAQESSFFSQTFAVSKSDLPAYIRREIAGMPGTRGFGYWLWKPHLIERWCAEGRSEFALYLDAGCVLNLDNSESANRLLQYREIAADRGIASFQIELPEFAWTKVDLLEHLRVSQTDRASGQVMSGVLLLRKSKEVHELVREWNLLMRLDNFHFLDDSPSIVPEVEGFVAHRHDQSILSCLLKIRGIEPIPDETYFPGAWTSVGRAFPVWTARHPQGYRFNPDGPKTMAAHLWGLRSRAERIVYSWADLTTKF